MKGILAMRRAEQLAMPTGRILNAQQFAEEVCGGHVSAKFVIKHFKSVGSKPGKEWLWYESEAKSAWNQRMAHRRAS